MPLDMFAGAYGICTGILASYFTLNPQTLCKMFLISVISYLLPKRFKKSTKGYIGSSTITTTNNSYLVQSIWFR